MQKNLVERYLTDIGEIRGTRSNVPETSFYPALERLLSDIGRALSPKVRCVINLANRGAGLPDGGLFSADQYRRKTRDADTRGNAFLVENPSRGVIEAKAPSEEVREVAGTEQVERYLNRYGMVLVTNFRAFDLIGKDRAGKPRRLESFTLAESENEFWRLTLHPRQAATGLGERMLEHLKRVLLHNAPLAAPQDVAGILASYAHDALVRIERADLPALTTLRQALEDALGLRFEGEKGEHFFRSTLIQTLFYGVFSAWVLWARRRDAKPSAGTGFADALRESGAPYAVTGDFDWRSAHHLLRVPMLRGLFVQVADPDRLGALDLIQVLDWTAATLNRVDRVEFFQSFDEGHAVQYFYEPFLHAFDPGLRKELGVWYTPEEIVRYQVERVDAVLRSELGLADGLADPNVVVLDPCCGTGAYLRAVLRRIAATLHDKGGDALVANDLKKAAIERVFGFEILPAPFVIAHLQLGLELETLGAPLSDRSDPPERAGVYLTNALTGWEPPKEKPKQIAFPGFEDERDAAGRVKREKPILVILGNPPYNAFAGISPEEEDGLVEPYKKGLVSEWGIKKFNLDDLYVRFFRLAEKRIAEHSGRGVVSFISNFSYLGDPSFVVARRRLLDEFDAIWVDCMNGDSRETGKLTPEGEPDPSVFSTEWNREGIRVGTAIGTFVKRTRARNGDTSVRFRQFWGTTKRADLLGSLEATELDVQYADSSPRKDNRWSLRPSVVATAYLGWPALADLAGCPPFAGIAEDRAKALISTDRDILEQRMRMYFSKSVDWHVLHALGTGLTKDVPRFDAKKCRAKLVATEDFDSTRLLPFAMRPFDIQWCYYSPVRPLWREPRPNYWAKYAPGTPVLVSRFKGTRAKEGPPSRLRDNSATIT
jgi:SAM-dependent methyltransferase